MLNPFLIDLDEPQRHLWRVGQQESYGLDFLGTRVLLQHHSSVHHLHPCQLSVGKQYSQTIHSHSCLTASRLSVDGLRSFSRLVAILLTRNFRLPFRCAAAGGISAVWFLPTHPHALVVEVSRRYHTFTLGPGCYCSILCVLGHFTADHLYLDWCHLQYVFLASR